MQEIESLQSICLKNILECERTVLGIGSLPNRLQLRLFIKALELDKKRVIPDLFQACSLIEINVDEIGRAVKESKFRNQPIQDEHIIAETLMSGFMHVLRTLQYSAELPELHLEVLDLKETRHEINETRRWLENNASITKNYVIVADQLSVLLDAHLGVAPAVGFAEFFSKNMKTRKGVPKFRVVYRRARVLCEDYPDFIRDVLEYLDSDIESLAIICNYKIRSSLPVLKRFSKLKQLEIQSNRDGNDERHLASVLSRMKFLEELRIVNRIQQCDGQVMKIVLKGCRPLKSFKYWNEHVTDNDLIWLGESKHHESLVALDFSNNNFSNSEAVAGVFCNFSLLESLWLQHCSLSKSQITKLCGNLNSCSCLKRVFLNQHTSGVRSFNANELVEILTELLRTKSKEFCEMEIDSPFNEEEKMEFESRCKNCIQDLNFGNIFGEIQVIGKTFSVRLIDD